MHVSTSSSVQGRALMAPYLPRNGASTSPYSEGGALYALGLIHASHGQDIREFLLESLRNANDPVGTLTASFRSDADDSWTLSQRFQTYEMKRK